MTQKVIGYKMEARTLGYSTSYEHSNFERVKREYDEYKSLGYNVKLFEISESLIELNENTTIFKVPP